VGQADRKFIKQLTQEGLPTFYSPIYNVQPPRSFTQHGLPTFNSPPYNVQPPRSLTQVRLRTFDLRTFREADYLDYADF